MPGRQGQVRKSARTNAPGLRSLSSGQNALRSILPAHSRRRTRHCLARLRGAMLLCHGFGEDDMATVRPEDEGYALESNFALQALMESRKHRFVICGHSHQPMVRSIQPLTIINAGTLDRRDRQVCSVIDFSFSRDTQSPPAAVPAESWCAPPAPAPVPLGQSSHPEISGVFPNQSRQQFYLAM